MSRMCPRRRQARPAAGASVTSASVHAVPSPISAPPAPPVQPLAVAPPPAPPAPPETPLPPAEPDWAVAPEPVSVPVPQQTVSAAPSAAPAVAPAAPLPRLRRTARGARFSATRSTARGARCSAARSTSCRSTGRSARGSAGAHCSAAGTRTRRTAAPAGPHAGRLEPAVRRSSLAHARPLGFDTDGDQVRQHPRPGGPADAMLIADAEACTFEQCPHLVGRRVVCRIEPIGGQSMQGERLPRTQGRNRHRPPGASTRWNSRSAAGWSKK